VARFLWNHRTCRLVALIKRHYDLDLRQALQPLLAIRKIPQKKSHLFGTGGELLGIRKRKFIGKYLWE